MVGKYIRVPELGTGEGPLTQGSIAKSILESYLFSACAVRWNPAIFRAVWDDCREYFDPSSGTVRYVLYAPVVGVTGIKRSIDLGDGLQIRRLPNHETARIASLDPQLAGVSFRHRLTLWPNHFLTKSCDLQKLVKQNDDILDFIGHKTVHDYWPSQINFEVTLLRSLLDEGISVPVYRLVRDGFPRDPGGGSFTDLSWSTPKWPSFRDPISAAALGAYRRRRLRFISMEGQEGWRQVYGSMRRFATAWDNPFPADILMDIVVALEGLIVRDYQEVSYKLRRRSSRWLGRTTSEQGVILKDLKDAYNYRSDVAHGRYVFDSATDKQLAGRLGVKGKYGNIYHDVNEVRRLTAAVGRYFRIALGKLINSSACTIDWDRLGLEWEQPATLEPDC